jgi:hypothetical protein
MRENESGREKRRNWKRAAEERREKPGADSRGAEQIKTAEAEKQKQRRRPGKPWKSREGKSSRLYQAKRERTGEGKQRARQSYYYNSMEGQSGAERAEEKGSGKNMNESYSLLTICSSLVSNTHV